MIETFSRDQILNNEGEYVHPLIPYVIFKTIESKTGSYDTIMVDFNGNATEYPYFYTTGGFHNPSLHPLCQDDFRELKHELMTVEQRVNKEWTSIHYLIDINHGVCKYETFPKWVDFVKDSWREQTK